MTRFGGHAGPKVTDCWAYEGDYIELLKEIKSW